MVDDAALIHATACYGAAAVCGPPMEAAGGLPFGAYHDFVKE